MKSRSPWLNRKIFLFVESLEEYHKVRYREILGLFFLETNLSKKTRKITQLAPLRSLNNGLYIGLVFNSSLFVSRENSKILFLFGKFLTYLINKYNNSCFSDLHHDYCPQLSHRPSKLGWYFFYFYGWYLDLQQYFLVQIEKTFIIVLVLPIFKCFKNCVSGIQESYHGCCISRHEKSL